MPAIPCPIEGCDYVTLDVDPVIVAALLTTHATVHAQKPHAPQPPSQEDAKKVVRVAIPHYSRRKQILPTKVNSVSYIPIDDEEIDVESVTDHDYDVLYTSANPANQNYTALKDKRRTKKIKNPYKHYSGEILHKATQLVKDGTISYDEAVAQFQIPRTSQSKSQSLSKQNSQIISQPTSQKKSKFISQPKSSGKSSLPSQSKSQQKPTLTSEIKCKPISQKKIISQTTSQPTSDSMTRSESQTKSQPVGQLESKTKSQPVSQSVFPVKSQPVDQSVSLEKSQSVTQWLSPVKSQPVSQLASQLMSQAKSQLMSKTISQPKSITKPTSQTPCQSKSQSETQPLTKHLVHSTDTDKKVAADDVVSPVVQTPDDEIDVLSLADADNSTTYPPDTNLQIPDKSRKTPDTSLPVPDTSLPNLKKSTSVKSGPARKRHYKDYSFDELQEAVQLLNSKKISYGKVSVLTGIPKSTLLRHFREQKNGYVVKKPGGQTVLSPEVEMVIANLISTLLEWRVTLYQLDLRTLVQNYLFSQKLTVTRIFKQNMPGPDWVAGFMKRHNLNQRIADNLRASIAKVNKDVIDQFFNYITPELRGLAANAIFNYSEVNLSDDLARKNSAIPRKRSRRLEQKLQNANICIMFSGNAAGLFLPPMVVYKSQQHKVYPGWTEGGMHGAEYAVTKTGWFDSTTFEQWFLKVFVENTKHIDGVKVLIGDNLGSHFSSDVIRTCMEKNIRFVTIPSKSTHLSQPFDVGVLDSLEQRWKKILFNWRKENKGCILKREFPGLFCRLIERTDSDLLKRGFEATGLFPVDRSRILMRFRSKKTPQSLLVSNNSVRPRKKRTKRCPRRYEEDYLSSSSDHNSHSTSSSSCSEAVEEETVAEDDHWKCRGCGDFWYQNSSQVWIECDRCNSPFHFHCCGLGDVESSGLDFTQIKFICKACVAVDTDS